MGVKAARGKVLSPPADAEVFNAIVERLVEKLDVEKIILFGSYVTGVPTRDSDLDLLVVVNTREKGLRRYGMVSELLEPRTIPMDIIVKTPRELRERARLFDPFISGVCRGGKVLYEKKA